MLFSILKVCKSLIILVTCICLLCFLHCPLHVMDMETTNDYGPTMSKFTLTDISSLRIKVENLQKL